ncbi:MAG TPA: bifunctional glutamate N-acetyltransferase/amino-acid acetyltransferase ArgJ [bacterium]|nr:bifunctional glutamate N-acetyltransferase/amino-acid acetyltransferase ArgJ [bacterium]
MKTPAPFPLPLGFTASGVHAGLKRPPKLDMGFLHSHRPAVWAGVVTKNAVKSAPARRTEALLKKGKPLRAVVVNTKYANDLTGRQGYKDVEDTARWAAAGLRHSPAEVLVHSTGVIGVPLPRAKVKRGVGLGLAALSGEGGGDFSRAILTTDLVPKTSARPLFPGGKPAWMVGFAKGSGMIHPNMATMLAYILTDAAVTRKVLAQALREAVSLSFNRITVDGDTSPSDSVVVLANGASGSKPITKASGPDYRELLEALKAVCLDLAQAVIRDGEGATKFVTVEIAGAKTDAQALWAAMAVAKSPLVKTAVFGADPNWGRILTAVGYSGASVDEFKARVEIGGYRLYDGAPKKGWSRARLKAILQKKDIHIRVDLRLGRGACRVYTCDLTDGYIDINGRYTT